MLNIIYHPAALHAFISGVASWLWTTVRSYDTLHQYRLLYWVVCFCFLIASPHLSTIKKDLIFPDPFISHSTVIFQGFSSITKSFGRSNQISASLGYLLAKAHVSFLWKVVAQSRRVIWRGAAGTGSCHGSEGQEMRTCSGCSHPQCHMSLNPAPLTELRPASDPRSGSEARCTGSYSRPLHPEDLDRSVSSGSQVRSSLAYVSLSESQSCRFKWFIYDPIGQKSWQILHPLHLCCPLRIVVLRWILLQDSSSIQGFEEAKIVLCAN